MADPSPSARCDMYVHTSAPSDGRPPTTEKLGENVYVDRNQAGAVVGVEVLDATEIHINGVTVSPFPGTFRGATDRTQSAPVSPSGAKARPRFRWELTIFRESEGNWNGEEILVGASCPATDEQINRAVEVLGGPPAAPSGPSPEATKRAAGYLFRELSPSGRLAALEDLHPSAQRVWIDRALAVAAALAEETDRG